METKEAPSDGGRGLFGSRPLPLVIVGRAVDAALTFARSLGLTP